jgi:hypothetical protein
VTKFEQKVIAIAIFIVILYNGWLVWQLVHWFERQGVELAWFWGR